VGNVGGGQDFHHPDDEAADHGAGDVADAAEHGRGKGLDAGHEAHVVAHRAVIQSHHDAGGGGQRGTDGEGNADDLVGVDAYQGGHDLVLGRGPHGLADARPVDQGVEQQQQQGRDRDDADLHETHAHAAHLEAALGEGRGIGLVVDALGEHEPVLEEDRHPERRKEHGQTRGPPQRLVGHLLHGHGQHGAVAHGQNERKGQPEPGMGVHQALGGEIAQKDDAHIAAGGEDRAMGEIDQRDDAVHHGVAEGHQGVDAAERQAVNQLLNKVIHASALFPFS